MTILGVDYSFARPDLAVLVQDGYQFVCRYLATEDPATAGKILSAAELGELHGAGLSVVLVFEDGASNALGGEAAGTADGTVAGNEANALGVPAAVPIYATVDFDVTADQYATVDAYVTAFAKASGRPEAVYGPAAYLATSTATYRWQAAGWNPTGETVAGVSLVQRIASTAPAGCDVDVALLDHYGQWSPPAVAPPAPAPVVTPTPAPEPSGVVAVNVPVLSQTNPGPSVVSATVGAVQCLLRQAVAPSLVVDGRFGPLTAQAVHDLEVQRGLSVDAGIVGSQVWSSLLALTPTP